MTAALIAGVSLAMQNPSCGLRIHQRAFLHPDGRTVSVALRFDIPKHWHIYWRNPGDSGQPTYVKWQTPSGWSLQREAWTAPSRMVVSGITSYGYEGTADQWATFKVPAGLRAGSTVNLKASADYLICKESCISGEGSTSRTVTLSALKGGLEAAAGLPKPMNNASATWDGSQYILRAKIAPARGNAVKAAYFYSQGNEVVDHAAEQKWTPQSDGLSITLSPSRYSEAPEEALTGVLRIMLNDGSTQSYSIGRAAVSRRSLE